MQLKLLSITILMAVPKTRYTHLVGRKAQANVKSVEKKVRSTSAILVDVKEPPARIALNKFELLPMTAHNRNALAVHENHPV